MSNWDNSKTELESSCANDDYFNLEEEKEEEEEEEKENDEDESKDDEINQICDHAPELEFDDFQSFEDKYEGRLLLFLF